MHPLLSGALRVERYTVAIADLPRSLVGTKLIQLSDLHYDNSGHLSEAMLAEAIEISNEEAPDLVLLTGDYITDEPDPIHRLVLRLKHLQARAGIYAILGNHDLYYPNSQMEVMAAFRRIDIRVLWNEIVYPLGSGLPLVGLADFWSLEYDPDPVMARIEPQTPRIVLSHNPDTAETLKHWRIDLMLAGHTHGGQVVIPGFGSIGLLLEPLRRLVPRPLHPYTPFLSDCSKVVDRWEWGLGWHRVGKVRMYVNRGLGTYYPGRLFCPPEITVMTLVSR